MGKNTSGFKNLEELKKEKKTFENLLTALCRYLINKNIKVFLFTFVTFVCGFVCLFIFD